VTQAVLLRIDMERYEVITVYWGEAVSEEQAQELASWISSRYRDKDVELIKGQQPYYDYIISAE
jgi:hypothetical protein